MAVSAGAAWIEAAAAVEGSGQVAGGLSGFLCVPRDGLKNDLTPGVQVRNYTKMEFEFDEAKSASNKQKHKIDFVEAQKLWLDPDAIAGPARSEKEERRLLIAKIEGKLWTAIYTEREGRVRIISVRRARPNEELLYEQTEDNSEQS